MVLSPGRGPYRGHLAQTGARAKVTADRKDEPIDESHGPSGGQDNSKRRGESDPCTVAAAVRLLAETSLRAALLQDREGHADHSQLRKALF